jgi:hypothetical protein
VNWHSVKVKHTASRALATQNIGGLFAAVLIFSGINSLLPARSRAGSKCFLTRSGDIVATGFWLSEVLEMWNPEKLSYPTIDIPAIVGQELSLPPIVVSSEDSANAMNPPE